MKISPKRTVELTAGVLSFDGQRLVPDARPGRLRFSFVAYSAIEVTWTPDGAPSAPLVLRIASHTAQFRRVKQAPAGSHVFMLVEQPAGQRHYFWLQSPNPDAILPAVNELLDADTCEGLAAPAPNPAQMAPEQILPSQITPMNTTNPTQNVSSSTNSGASSALSIAGLQAALNMARSHEKDPSLVRVLDPAAMERALRREAVWAVAREHLPPGVDTLEDAAVVLRSPQFQQGVRAFEEAAKSEQWHELCVMLGVQPAQGDWRGSVGALVRAFLQKYSR